jgi:hypothetical protein
LLVHGDKQNRTSDIRGCWSRYHFPCNLSDSRSLAVRIMTSVRPSPSNVWILHNPSPNSSLRFLLIWTERAVEYGRTRFELNIGQWGNRKWYLSFQV